MTCCLMNYLAREDRFSRRKSIKQKTNHSISSASQLAIIVTSYFCLLSLPQANGDYESDFFGPKLVIRAPRSITNIFRRFFGGRRKQTVSKIVTSEAKRLGLLSAAGWLRGQFDQNGRIVAPKIMLDFEWPHFFYYSLKQRLNSCPISSIDSKQ